MPEPKRRNAMERRTLLGLGIAGIGALALTSQASALQYYPKSSDKKWAVLFATWCGSSRDAGVWISEGLGGIADVYDLRENPDLKKFDNIIIGSSIRSGKVKPEIKQYLEANASWLKDKIRGLYIVCGNGQKPITPEIEKKYVTDQLQAYSSAKDVPSHVFLGRVTAALLDPPIREALLSRGGEYDNLKRSESLAFGQELLKHA
jgi:menaquinone-dependent protoporphyrinogen IX oxidase